jgi:hypothetical protein
MAAQEHSSTRRRVLGAAAALPVLALTGFPSPVIASREAARQSSPAQARWNRRLARYRRLHARWKTEAESGAFRAVNDRYNREQAALCARFGSWDKACRSRTGKPLCSAAFTRIEAAEDTYYDNCTAPMHRAAARLIVTPAPDLPALLAKIEIIREHELDTFDDLPKHPLDVLREDVAGLIGDQDIGES